MVLMSDCWIYFAELVSCVAYSKTCGSRDTCIRKQEVVLCLCEAGFTGFECEININECEHSLCENNGTCIDQIAAYDCNCSSSFTGNCLLFNSVYLRIFWKYIILYCLIHKLHIDFYPFHELCKDVEQFIDLTKLILWLEKYQNDQAIHSNLCLIRN